MKFMQKAAVLKVTQKREIIKYLAKNYSTIVNSNITLVENYSRIQRLTGALPKSSRAMNESACAFFQHFVVRCTLLQCHSAADSQEIHRENF